MVLKGIMGRYSRLDELGYIELEALFHHVTIPQIARRVWLVATGDGLLTCEHEYR